MTAAVQNDVRAAVQNQIQERMYRTERKNYATASIFGAVILNRRVIPGCVSFNENLAQERQRELYETVDDYVEQA